MYSGSEQQRERALHLKSFLASLDENFRQYMNSKPYLLLSEHAHLVSVWLQKHPLFCGVESTVPCTPFISYEGISSLRPVLSDTSLSRCDLKSCVTLENLGADMKRDIVCFATTPLSCISLKDFVGSEPAVTQGDEKTGGTRAREQLPFDLTGHPLAQTPVAQRLLERLGRDVSGFAESYNSLDVPKILYLLSKDIQFLRNGDNSSHEHTRLEDASKLLDQLVKSLDELLAKDSKLLEETIILIEQDVNQVFSTSPPDQQESSMEIDASEDQCLRLRHVLRRYGGQSALISFNFMTTALLSSSRENDVIAINPFVSKNQLASLFDTVAVVLLYASRIQQTNRAGSRQLASETK